MILHAGNVRSGASCPSPPQRRHLRWKDLHPEEPAAKAAGSDVQSCHELQINFQALYLCVRCIQMHTRDCKIISETVEENCQSRLDLSNGGLFNGDTHKPSWKPKQHGPLRQTALVLATW